MVKSKTENPENQPLFHIIEFWLQTSISMVHDGKSINKVKNEGIEPIITGMLPNLLSPHTLSSNPALVAQVREIMQSVSPQGYIGDLMGMKNRPDSVSLNWLDSMILPAWAASALDTAATMPTRSGQAMVRI